MNIVWNRYETMLFLNDEQEGEDTGSCWIVNRDATSEVCTQSGAMHGGPTFSRSVVGAGLERMLSGRQESMSTDQPCWRLMGSCARGLWHRKEVLRFSLNHASCIVTDVFYWDDKWKSM